MSDESKYRVEEPEETDETEKKGFLRPLPEAPKPVARDKDQPMVKFLWITMTESTRDKVILIFMPLLAGIFDSYIYSLVIVQILEETMLYLFVIPMLAAILIGLTVTQTKWSLIGGLIGTLFFAVFFMLFLVSPGFAVPEIGPGEFFVSGLVIIAVYSLFITLANLLGTLFGAILREFF